jgi:enoyl-CoA hydratase/carnithine racemase
MMAQASVRDRWTPMAMDRHDLTPRQLAELLARPLAAEELATGGPAGTLLVVEGTAEPNRGQLSGTSPDGCPPPRSFGGLPAVVVRVSAAAAPADDPLAPLVDVVVSPDGPELAAIGDTVRAAPLAATALALLLRGAADRTAEAGLVAESSVYSTLQGGPEFAAWRAAHPPTPRSPSIAPTVLADRRDTVLDVALNRPDVRNAVSARLRDELCEALAVALEDPDVEEVHLRGNGRAFCAGGDLDEFGTLPDPATAHLVRLARSPARLLACLAPRVTAHLHGACIGSGIELPAFAGRVVAEADTVIGLPEVGLGLVPGAGGTVSLPARIGRHRTAQLALTGHRIDAATARAWGLVDEIEADEIETAP